MTSARWDAEQVKNLGGWWEGRKEGETTGISLCFRRQAHQEGETEASELGCFIKQARRN